MRRPIQATACAIGISIVSASSAQPASSPNPLLLAQSNDEWLPLQPGRHLSVIMGLLTCLFLLGVGRWDLKYPIDANADDSATLATKLSARELAGGAEGVQNVEALDGR